MFVSFAADYNKYRMKIGNVNFCKKCAENCPKLQLFNKKLAAVIYCTDYHGKPHHFRQFNLIFVAILEFSISPEHT